MAKNDEETKKNLSRRNFIRTAAGAATAAVATKQAKADVYKSILPSTVLGANEKIITGHIGTGGMGRADLRFCLQRDDIKPIALCDLYPKNLERGAQMLSSKFKDFTQHHDFREIIENKDIDVVVIATSDHWHCLCTLHAADAGKDIYCEKPLATTIEEGRAMINAVRRNKVVFQGGNMQRSGEHFQKAVELVKSGVLGKVAHVETFIHDAEPITGIGHGENDPKKYNADWEFHQGWVEHKPFNTNRWIYNFRWFYDYAGAKLTDWGAHLIDIGLWAMGEDKQPKTVTASGGKYVVDDNRTTPDVMQAVWEYDDYILTFANRVWNQFLPKGFQDHGILFHGTFGTLRVDRGGFEIYPVRNNEGKEAEAQKSGPSALNEPHWQNFVDCIRSRKDPIMDVETAHRVATFCHLGNIARWLGRRLEWDPQKEEFPGDDEANQYLDCPRRKGYELPEEV